MLQELERKRAELMREVHAVSAAIKAYAETIGQHSGAAKNVRTKTLSLAAKARWAKDPCQEGVLNRGWRGLLCALAKDLYLVGYSRVR
jgi:hypothetical protein